MKTFKDPRDGQTYKTVEINGKIWLVENLNYDVGDGCWIYGDDPKNEKKYGRLYTWEAAKKACPPGWRLPTNEEWNALLVSFGGPEEAYEALTEGGSSDFAVLPGGWRTTDGTFGLLGYYGNYWSGTQEGTQGAWFYEFSSNGGELCWNYDDKSLGLSCRCVKD